MYWLRLTRDGESTQVRMSQIWVPKSGKFAWEFELTKTRLSQVVLNYLLPSLYSIGAYQYEN